MGLRQQRRDGLLACQKLLGNMVWRGRLLQDQAWNWALWSGLSSLYLCLLCCLKKLNKLSPTEVLRENKQKSKSNTFNRVLTFGTAKFGHSSVFSTYSAP